MPSHCCVIGCMNRSYDGVVKKLHGVSFFRIPAWKTHSSTHVSEVTKRRRMAWVAAIRRSTITFATKEAHYVCSHHFHKGKPAYEMMECDPDWAPSLKLGHTEVKPTDKGRSQRAAERAALATSSLPATKAAPSHTGQPAYEMLENHPDWKPSLMLGHSDVRETDQGRYQRHLKRRAKAKWPTGQSKKHQQPPQPQPPPHQDVVQQEEVQQHQDQHHQDQHHQDQHHQDQQHQDQQHQDQHHQDQHHQDQHHQEDQHHQDQHHQDQQHQEDQHHQDQHHQDQRQEDQQLLAEVKEEVVEVRLGVDVKVESEDEAEQEVEQEVKEEVEREVERRAPLPDKELPPNQDAVRKPPSPRWNSYHHNDHSSMARAPQPRREHPPNQDTVQPPPPVSAPGSFYQILQTQHDDHSGMARVECSGMARVECSLCKSRQDLINCLLEEKRELAKQLEEYRMNEGFLKGDDGKVRYYTGLPNLEVFQVFLLSVVPLLQQGKRKLTPFQYVLLTLMRLRLDLPIQHLSYLFGVNRSTVSAAFQETVGLLHSLLCRDEDGLFSSIPRSFVESLKGKCQKVLSDAESVAPRKRTSKNSVAVKGGGNFTPKENDTTADSVTVKNSGTAKDGVTPKPNSTPKDSVSTKPNSTPKDSVSTKPSGTPKDSVSTKPNSTPKDSVSTRDSSTLKGSGTMEDSGT